MHEYFFDLDLRTCLRVHAKSEAEARKIIERTLDCVDANLGSWPNGDPIVTEASLKDPATIELVEIDGKAVVPGDTATSA